VYITAFIVAPSPSGFVPGDSAGGRGVKRILFFGREGPDCLFQTLVGLLFVKVEGLVVFSFSYNVLHVTCIPTD
jgi:hypothetical protein